MTVCSISTAKYTMAALKARHINKEIKGVTVIDLSRLSVLFITTGVTPDVFTRGSDIIIAVIIAKSRLLYPRDLCLLCVMCCL